MYLVTEQGRPLEEGWVYGSPNILKYKFCAQKLKAATGRSIVTTVVLVSAQQCLLFVFISVVFLLWAVR